MLQSFYIKNIQITIDLFYHFPGVKTMNKYLTFSVRKPGFSVGSRQYRYPDQDLPAK